MFNVKGKDLIFMGVGLLVSVATSCWDDYKTKKIIRQEVKEQLAEEKKEEKEEIVLEQTEFKVVK